jgi:hypothetical protein
MKSISFQVTLRYVFSRCLFKSRAGTKGRITNSKAFIKFADTNHFISREKPVEFTIKCGKMIEIDIKKAFVGSHDM